MDSDHRNTELAQGAVSPCTVDDRPALVDLYRAAYPDSSGFEAAADIRVSDIPAWAAYRDASGEIRVGMYAVTNGVVWVIARPQDADSPEVRRGFVMLATEIRKVLVSQGVKDLTIVHSVYLENLANQLEREGFLGKGVVVARAMRFGESGEVDRVV